MHSTALQRAEEDNYGDRVTESKVFPLFSLTDEQSHDFYVNTRFLRQGIFYV